MLHAIHAVFLVARVGIIALSIQKLFHNILTDINFLVIIFIGACKEEFWASLEFAVMAYIFFVINGLFCATYLYTN